MAVTNGVRRRGNGTRQEVPRRRWRQQGRPRNRRQGRRWGRLVPLVAVLAATVALGACGNSGSGSGGVATPMPTSQAIGSEPPAATSNTQATPSGPPSAHYILMCAVGEAGNTLTWLNPTTLQVLYQETIIPPSADVPTVFPVGELDGTGFAPTATPAASTSTPAYNSFGGCGNWQLSADETSIVGIDVIDNSAVPATYNLVTGTTTDIVAPPTTSGFAASTPVTYFGAYYAPDGKSVWSLQCNGSDDDMTLHAPNGQVEANIPSTITDSGGFPFCDNSTMVDSYLIWLPGASTPTIVTQDIPLSGAPYPYNMASIPMASGDADMPLTAAQAASLPLLDPSALPQSNWTYSYIHRAPDDSNAAFIAQNKATDAWAMFTVNGVGMTPQQINAPLPGCTATCGDVLAYDP
jgi:hypothetical protein